jgi:hypothetical protein
MENKSTDNNISTPVSTEHKVVCRKCGGPHFTIKCGKDKKVEEQQSQPESKHEEDKTNNVRKPKSSDKDKPSDNKEKVKLTDKVKPRNDTDEKPYHKKPFFKTTYRVKLSELPNDITEEEMMELTCDWGHVVKIRVLNYEESSTSYIDFGYEDEADYFIKALDKTPFEYMMLQAIRVDSTYTKPTN